MGPSKRKDKISDTNKAKIPSCLFRRSFTENRNEKKELAKLSDRSFVC